MVSSVPFLVFSLIFFISLFVVILSSSLFTAVFFVLIFVALSESFIFEGSVDTVWLISSCVALVVTVFVDVAVVVSVDTSSVALTAPTKQNRRTKNIAINLIFFAFISFINLIFFS